MKKITLVIIALCLTAICFAQDTEAPTTPINFQFVDNPTVQPDNISVQWEHATDNVGVATYEVYINGILEEIIPYNASNTIQYASLLNYPNGTHCVMVLAKDAAGNASPLSNQVCKYVNVIYQNAPVKPYFSGFLNYSGDNKAIEISNQTFQDIDLSDYSLKISYNGSGTWDATYTFPANTILQQLDVFVIANSNISICTSEVDDYNNIITNFDGNDVIGLFKYDIFYDAIGELGNNATLINTDLFIKKEYISGPTPSTIFNINNWEVYGNNGSCPGLLGFSYLVLLDVEDENLNAFQMYPNPTNGDIVYITTKNNTEISEARIYDITGKQVLTQVNSTNEINVQGLQRGLYILQLQIGNQTVTKKLIKQ